MLSCSTWFSAPSFRMGGGHESRCVGRVYGADAAVRPYQPHRTHDLRSGSQDHHPSINSVQKTICCNSISNAPDDGRMYPKQVDLRIHSIKLPSCIKLAFHFISFIWSYPLNDQIVNFVIIPLFKYSRTARCLLIAYRSTLTAEFDMLHLLIPIQFYGLKTYSRYW